MDWSPGVAPGLRAARLGSRREKDGFAARRERGVMRQSGDLLHPLTDVLGFASVPVWAPVASAIPVKC